MRRRPVAVVGTLCAAAVLIASAAACSSTGEASSTPSAAVSTATQSPASATPLPALMRTATARAGKPSPHLTIVEVPPGQASAVLKAASQRVGFTIKTPGYIPGPANQLVRVTTNEIVHQDDPNVSMTAQLMYEAPGATTGAPLNGLMVIEDAGHYSSPPTPATPIAAPSGANYHVYVDRYPPKSNIPFAAVYTFMTSKNTTTFTLSLQKPVTDTQVIKMYESLK